METILCFTLVIAFSYAGKSSIDVLVMGDWGGISIWPYTTPEERNTASIMGDVAAQYQVDMVWGLGDNFYYDGVTDEYDARFNETFEDVFTSASLQQIPFYMIAGNHDHHQNVSGEIFYSNHSARWTYPNFWYSVEFQVPQSNLNRSLQLVMIDTVLLSGTSDDLEYCQSNAIAMQDCRIQPTGPADLNLAQSQWEWIESTLKTSTADYLVVAGHYPVWSIGEHGPTSDLVQHLDPLLKQYNATAYFSGHDHTFEYIQTADSRIGYVVTGGAHICDPSIAHVRDVPEKSLKFHGCVRGGFTRISANDTAMSLYYYYGSSTNIQYQTVLFPRK